MQQMTVMPFRFSVVIPTRNRPETLRYTLRTCIDQMLYDDYEIVINDNSDADLTGILVDELIAADDRARQLIKYHRRSTVCCMTENFDDAIGRAQGQYVIVIGDDDGILPMALYEIDRLIDKHDVKIVKWKNGLYNWPSMASQEFANYLGFSLTRSSRSVDGRRALADCMTSHAYDSLPMLYINSAVRSDLIASTRGEDKTLFRSQSPDVYSGIVLAYHSRSFLEVSTPFTLAGLSKYSNGMSSAFNGSNSAPRLDFRALNARAGIHHHPHVPDLSIYPTIAFSDSFYFAKQAHFPDDSSFELPRRGLMEACVARADTEVEAVRAELLRVCEDDADLADFTRALIAAKTETLPPPRLKPAQLGFDGENLHFDPRDYGVATVADAVALVHRIVWPADAPLRYDVSSAADVRASLEATLQDLQRTRGALVQRSGDLELALDELQELRGTLVQRSADLEATLADIGEVRELLIDRTTRLEAALAECRDLRGRLATDH